MTPSPSGGQEPRRPHVVLRWSGASHYSQVTLGKGSDDNTENEPMQPSLGGGERASHVLSQKPEDRGGA